MLCFYSKRKTVKAMKEFVYLVFQMIIEDILGWLTNVTTILIIPKKARYMFFGNILFMKVHLYLPLEDILMKFPVETKLINKKKSFLYILLIQQWILLGIFVGLRKMSSSLKSIYLFAVI